MDDIAAYVQILSKKNKNNDSYDNIVNSAIIVNSSQQAAYKINNDKVATGNINATGDNIVKNVLVMPTQQRTLTAINQVINKYPTYGDGVADISRKNSVSVISNNDKNYEFVPTVDITTIKEPTVVLSDPSNPDTTSSTVHQSDISHFDINDIYQNTDNINMYENRYVNINSKQQILNTDVVSFSDEGIILETGIGSSKTMPTYSLIPNDYLEQSTITDYDDFAKFSTYIIKDKTVTDDMYHERVLGTSIVSTEQVKYKYFYGIGNVTAEYHNIVSAAGFISEPIAVTPNLFVELEANTTYGVEYSVIEGEKETPILPKGLTEVIDEKLFFGMMPRFVILNPNDIIVKRNDVITGITTQRQLELFLIADTVTDQTGGSSFFDDAVYTITYKPGESAGRYFPKTDSIKVKVVQREPVNQEPEPVKTIKLLQAITTGSVYLDNLRTKGEYNDSNDQIRKEVKIWST